MRAVQRGERLLYAPDRKRPSDCWASLVPKHQLLHYAFVWRGTNLRVAARASGVTVVSTKLAA